MTKFCKDCKHYGVNEVTEEKRRWSEEHNEPYDEHYCDIAKIAQTDLVTGKSWEMTIPINAFRYEGECGREGNLWEKKDD